MVRGLRRSVYTNREMIAAIDEYHACVTRTVTPAIAAVLRLGHRFNLAMTDGDREVMGQLLAGDFRLVDHRPIGYEDATRQDVLDVVAAVNRSTTHRGLARNYQ